MDIKLLEDFVCLARVESFTDASFERNITQSALSRRIKALENWLDVKLINRDSKNFNLTVEGRVFISEAETVLRRLYNAKEAVHTIHSGRELQIIVAAPNTIAQTIFLDWAKRLEENFGNIYIQLVSENMSDCVELFIQGKVDYLFCYGHDMLNLPISQNRFSSITIGKDSLVPVTIPDQNNKPLYQFISHNCYLSRRYENTYSHTLKTMVREGLGLAWIPNSIVQTDFKNKVLCRAGDKHWDINFDIKLFHHHDVNSSRETAILKTSIKMSEEVI